MLRVVVRTEELVTMLIEVKNSTPFGIEIFDNFKVRHGNVFVRVPQKNREKEKTIRAKVIKAK